MKISTLFVASLPLVVAVLIGFSLSTNGFVEPITDEIIRFHAINLFLAIILTTFIFIILPTSKDE